MNFIGFVSVPLLILTLVVSARCELITIGLVGSIGSLLGGVSYYGYEKYKCMYMECCTDEYIPSDLDSKYELDVQVEKNFFIYYFLFIDINLYTY